MVLLANHIMLCCAPLEVDEEKKKALEAMIVGGPSRASQGRFEISRTEGEVIRPLRLFCKRKRKSSQVRYWSSWI